MMQGHRRRCLRRAGLLLALVLPALPIATWAQGLPGLVSTPGPGGSQTWSLGWNIYPTDLNGDGRTDFLLYHPGTGVWYQARNIFIGNFAYSTGTWSPNLVIIVRSPFM